MSPEDRIAAAIEVAENYAYIDGAHHKQWVIDQMMRALLGDGYEEWVGSDVWDEGTPP